MILIPCLKADKEALEAIAVDPSEIKDDGTDYLNVRIVKPWGHEKERYRDETLAVWWLDITRSQMTSMHCHPSKLTLLLIIGGRGTLVTLNKDYPLSEGELVIIEKGAFHRIKAGDKTSLVLYELETPVNKRDLVRLSDEYGRGQGYERVEPAQKLSQV